MSGPYVDDYATCEQTYVTLRLYSLTATPEEISSALGIEPTRVLRMSEVRNPQGRRPVTQKQNGWFLSSEGHVQSRDVRRHLDWLLDQISKADSTLKRLTDTQVGGVRADVACVWFSRSGHGGPTLSPSQMLRLGALGLDCWFDLYSGEHSDESSSTSLT